MATSSLQLPRLYQLEALERARQHNIICRMDTGTGKTLIGVLLVRHITSLPPSSSHSLVVWLVPKVDLVSQTHERLASQTCLRIKSFTGDMNVKNWIKGKWTGLLEESDVVIMTAQIWLDVLASGFWSMANVTLIVIDEAHNARGQHPYAQIMLNHYHAPKSEGRTSLPRVLGLSASLVYSAKNPEKDISKLESLLDAQVYEVSIDHSEALQSAAPKPIEHLDWFDPSPDYEETTAEKLLKSKMELDPNTQNKFIVARQQLGPYGSPILASYLLPSLTPYIPTYSPTLLSPQVHLLLQTLSNYSTIATTFHAIVFVSRRDHAKILAEITSQDEELKKWCRIGWMVGGQSQGGKTLTEEETQKVEMANRKRREVFAKFRKGEINLLFATQVMEEGIDAQSCNVVIRFDGVETRVAYVQSRGRARSPSSHYHIFASPGSREEANYLEFSTSEPALNELYGSRINNDTLEEPDLPNTPTYTHPSTGALLTFPSSFPLLANFCSLLRTDPFSPPSKPTYVVIPTSSFTSPNQSFTCTLSLPRIPSLSSGVPQTIVGRQNWSTKKAARQAVAFEACLRLIESGGITENFLPRREKRGEGGIDADGKEVGKEEVVGKEGVEVQWESAFGDVAKLWEREGVVWVNEVFVGDGEREKVVVVCGEDLNVWFGGGGHAGGGKVFEKGTGKEVRVKVGRSEKVRMGKERMEMLRRMNWEGMRTVVNRRLGEEEKEKFSALWAPGVQKEGRVEVDWEKVERSLMVIEDPKMLKEGELVVIPARRPSDRLGTFVRVRSDVDSQSKSGEIELEAGRTRTKLSTKYNDNYAAFCSVAYEYHSLFKSPAEPILQLSTVPLSPSNLLTFSSALKSPTSSPPRQRNFPLSMCRLTSLTPSFWSVLSMVPSLNRMIEETVQARKVVDKFGFGVEMELDRLVEGLTPPSATTERDYQYLETVGDSLLKVATTVHTYLEFPDIDEGRLSIIRQNSVDNRFLRNKSLSIGYASYILSSPFRPYQWTPLSEGDLPSSDPTSPTFTHTVGKRALADTIEATLGAALSSGGLSLGLQVGTKLGLCFGGNVSWDQRMRAKELSEDGERSSVSVGFRELERKLGYEFKRKGKGLVQALTHRSWTGTETYSYEREEYLGDALLDFWATTRIYSHFPSSTPRHLTFLRALLVSNSTLSFLAIRKLSLHKLLLHQSPLLELTMNEAALMAEGKGYEAVLSGELTWTWDAPKALGDALEACLGAVFVDDGCRMEGVERVLDELFEEILEGLGEVEMRDPISKLEMFTQKRGLKLDKIKATRAEGTPPVYTASCTLFNGTNVISTATNTSKNIARQVAAREALEWFEDEGNEVVWKGWKEEREVEEMRRGMEVDGVLVEIGGVSGGKREREEGEGDGEGEEEEDPTKVGGEEEDVEPAPQRVRVY